MRFWHRHSNTFESTILQQFRQWLERLRRPQAKNLDMMSKSFHRLQARKMSKRRARSGSPTKTIGSKRKSTVTEPVEEFTFCEDGVTSEIDTHFATFQTPGVRFMVAKILEKPDGFLATAKLRMKAFLKFVEEGVPISSEDENSLLREVWLYPCFYRSLAAAMDYDVEMIHSTLGYLKQDTLAERIARMKADPNFEPSVKDLRKDNSISSFLRLFLSILIGYWGEEGLLRELEQKMGTKEFVWRLDMIAKAKAREIERAGKADEIEDFSYVIEDISHANDMEPLRSQMVEKYATREDRDIEALLGKIDLYDLLSIAHNHLGYDGKKAEIFVQVVNGCHCGITMKALPSNNA
ncbi:hypothetical protein CASFOL_041245 [Castilleja foliolosa]|uniref:Uncharacterized protein n=1 Tax=Castilleja foliolosa TaxID=1961234 RepID=A0ABD3BE98_9LAMI